MWTTLTDVRARKPGTFPGVTWPGDGLPSTRYDPACWVFRLIDCSCSLVPLPELTVLLRSAVGRVSMEIVLLILTKIRGPKALGLSVNGGTRRGRVIFGAAPPQHPTRWVSISCLCRSRVPTRFFHLAAAAPPCLVLSWYCQQIPFPTWRTPDWAFREAVIIQCQRHSIIFSVSVKK